MTAFVYEAIQETWAFLGNNYEAVIATCALALTLFQFRTMRKHNLISVRPHLTDHSHKEQEKEDEHVFSFYIINNGLGPAFIKAFKVYKDNQLLEWNSEEELDDKISILLPCGSVEHIRKLAEGSVLAPQEQYLLLSIRARTKKASENYNQILEALNRLNIAIDYCSMYQEEMKHYHSGKANKLM